MNRVDAAFAAITARARAAAEPEPPAPSPTPPPSGRTGRDRTGLDVPTGIECEICPTGWAAVRLYTPGFPRGRVACPRCAEKARMRAVTYRYLGAAFWEPLTDDETGR